MDESEQLTLSALAGPGHRVNDTQAALAHAPDPNMASRGCLVCSRTEGVVHFASVEAVRCLDCIRAHGVAVSAAKRSAAGKKVSASALRARARAERLAAEDAALQERAAVRAAARGVTYVMQAELSPPERLALQSEDQTERRLEQEARRAKRAHDATELASAVAIRKAERRPLARLARRLAPELRAARTLDEEIRALVVGLDERASAWVLKRWGYLEWPVPSLESLGESAGVTRERARQVVALHETRLQELRDGEHSLRLRLADRAVAVLSARGGMLDTAALRSALEAEEVPASVPALRALVALGAASLIPSVLWDAASDLWLDAANQTVLHDGSLDRARRAFLTGARLALKRTGAVSLTRVANATPLPHDHAISLLFGPTSCTRVSGYLVPDVQEESRLSRRALEMATVSPGIGIEDIRLGVRRIVPKPIRLSAPVVRAVLERHAAFRLDGGAVYAVEQLPLDQLLYPADVILIGALRERGGVMLFPEVKALLSSAGIRQGYFLRAAHVAWLVGLRGAFGLRGHPGIAGLAETNERRTPGLPRSRVFVKLLWSDNDSAAVRYRVIPASLRGVLRLPNRLVERLREPGPEWTVTATPPLPDTGTVAVGTEVGTLWDLRPWLVAVSARRGQHIEVSVALTARRVTLRLIDAETAAEDEARWAQEQLLRWAHRPSHSGEEKTREERGIGPRGGRPRMPTVTVKEFGDYFTVPNDVHDLSDATFHRLKGTPAPDSDLLVAALPSFPLAPGTTGVVMCLVFQLTASKGRRRLYSDLLETRILERATAVTWADATHLVRNLDRHLVRGRLSLAWREYRSPSATENGDLAATQDHISASESGHANHGTTE